ncbi:DEAD/DEAH box helicase [Staphylococcus coagulans]|uniref:DEAD/DEAH box helicase n=1 Tax=Staphylococcus coagulans TaxID=74706 RepID=UPI0015FAE456|nr:DEAD/DEAH box helicase [Staphylococcus coagulans]MBA8764346.1 hypothetical protein [Staphylococcus coagulans]MBT2809806.1 hypothetical protein [Staphylococcus coagulans]MBT2811948.1 hypothetical protein [Staphylococcus coagulans]MBT2818942.1 hypothetical protein [Staphylococcus coagulans]MBT2821314.1 hypothetical protein [Staphylococcus coagulans]
MDRLVNNTLSAWILIETLQPGELEDIKSYLNKDLFLLNEQQKAVHDFESFYPIWEDERFQLNQLSSSKGEIQFQLYRHCFKFGEIEQYIRSIFNDEEIYNPDNRNCYGYTFMIDNEGYVLMDTLHVPMLMSALKYLKNDKNILIEETYQDHFEKFKHKCEEIIGNNKLTKEKLHKLDQLYSKYFALFETNYQGFFKQAIGIKYVTSNEQSNELNSFYISDMEFAKKDPNKTLSQYLHGVNDKDKKVIDENKEYIEHYLKPEFYPDGRWPSLIEHRLSLMQQVAVNQITHDQMKISSVNGPPGTGKTTLLKDIFAHNIVERAKTFAKLNKPSQAFKFQKIHETDQFPTAFLNDVHTHYKMVVASSNNGAVENISKDLPKISEVVRSDISSNFPKYEEAYQNVAKELDIFSEIAEKLIGEKAWGLFSGVFGRKANIDSVMTQVLTSSESKTLNKVLIDAYNSIDIHKEWKDAKQSFQKTLSKVKVLKKEINQGIKHFDDFRKSEEQFIKYQQELVELNDKNKNNNIDSLKQRKKNLENQIINVDVQINDLKEYIQLTKSKNSFKDKLKQFLGSNSSDDKDTEYEQRHADLLRRKFQFNDDKIRIDTEITMAVNEINERESRINQIEQNLMQLRKNQQGYLNFIKEHPDVVVPDSEFWRSGNEAYNMRQEKVLWTSDELQFERGLLFLKAMVLHKLILIGNAKSIQSGLYDFQRRFEYLDAAPEKVENAWNVIHLVFPVISTTFASFRSMYQTMPKDFIDYLYIDEAGQAIPQAAVGAIQRAQHLVAVGDPVQIEPVVTIDRNLIDSVRKAFNVPERLVSIESSVQTLSDGANIYGYWKGEEGEKQWIGVPLWVHRRCLNPMFTISNKIAYEQKMVLPEYIKSNELEGKVGRVSWIDVKGKANPKQFVKEQGIVVVEELKKDWVKALKSGKQEPNVFIITPFSRVKSEIIAFAKKELKPLVNQNINVRKWLHESIGTVHTFQGKEADKVYFVTGTDDTQNTAIQWSCQKPNLINVAVTRAKKEFIVVGDKKRISQFRYYQAIDKEINI